METIFGKT